MAPDKSIMFQWEATPPRVYVLDGFINKRKKMRTENWKGRGREWGLEGLWRGRLGRGECDLNPSSGILRELIKRNKQAINTQENRIFSETTF